MKYEVYYDTTRTYDDYLARKLTQPFSTREAAQQFIKTRVTETGNPASSYSIKEVVDNVESPEHYTRLSPEPVDVIVSWGLDFPTGSAVKYLARAGHKTGAAEIDDLHKAISFINHKIRLLEKK